MKQSSKISPKIIISGGGTGGHIYPAIAIADEIKFRFPDSEILFVGAEGKMEMEKIPKAGYQIKGLPISGIDRGNWLSNLNFPLKLRKSLHLAKKITKEFNPDVAIGTGGYASGPLLWQASRQKIPFVIQEQNAFPGITNKLLKNKASAICVAYENIAQFPLEKTHCTGNPIRSEIFQDLPDKKTACSKFNLNPDKLTILSVGGSQGSRTLNNAWMEGWEEILTENVQLIWQTGKVDFEKIQAKIGNEHMGIHVTDFIYDMKSAYAAADIIASRAGAMAISELCLIGKPVILIPFPFAAENHQFKNAEALVKNHAAKMLTDEQVPQRLVNDAIELLYNDSERNQLSDNIKKLGKPNATKEIVDILMNLVS